MIFLFPKMRITPAWSLDSPHRNLQTVLLSSLGEVLVNPAMVQSVNPLASAWHTVAP